MSAPRHRRFLQGIILTAGLCLAALLASSAAEPPLRVVPQTGWAGQGVASPDGSLFVTGMEARDSHSVRLVSKEGVLLWTLPLIGPSAAAFSPDGKWLAACGSYEGLLLNLKTCELRFFPALRGLLVAFTPDSRKVPIVRRSSDRQEADDGLLVFDLDAQQTGRFPVEMDVPHTIEVLALQFVGRDRLLTGTGNGRVQLWDLRRREPLWTAETHEEILQFGYVPGGPYVVCTNLFRSGTVLQMGDGKVAYKTPRLRGGDSSVVLPWAQPQLVGRGEWALEMDAESMQVRLVELATGRAALTYCGLGEGQWIVYTPDGDWDGSDQVHRWVKFCDGLTPLPPVEADRRRGRERIEAVLRRAFATIKK